MSNHSFFIMYMSPQQHGSYYSSLPKDDLPNIIFSPSHPHSYGF